MNIIIWESQMKRILSEQITPLKIEQNDKFITINGQNYKLQIYKFGTWKNVDINYLKPRPDGGYDIKASLGLFSQSDIVPVDTVQQIISNLGKPEINLGGKTAKKLVKI